MESLEEKIKKFLRVSSGDGDGSGSGSGYGYGFGFGSGSGYGSGYGFGDGSGTGYEYSDSGYGDGSGDGSDDGSGDGFGFGYGLKLINGNLIYLVDGVQTIFFSIRGNVAKGAIINNDLTISNCYVVKGNDCFKWHKLLKGRKR